MICGECKFCCVHYPLSGMQSDGFVCCANYFEGDEHFVELNQECDVY